MASTVQHLIPESQTPDSLVTATEEMSLQEALERMSEHDFSQLPVVDKEFKLKGLVTSDSILKTVSYFGSTLNRIKVSHATFNAKACRLDDDLSELLNGLRDTSAIPIVDKLGKLTAIITNYDTAEYYRQRAEDIMLAEDIETTLRDYIETAYRGHDGSINCDALQQAIADITPSGKDVRNKLKQAICSYLGRSAQGSQPDHQLIDEVYVRYLHQPVEAKAFEDLTLFEYVQIFKNLWDRYKAAFNHLEWEAIDRLLSDVRQTRNAIAHFREVTPAQRQQLKFCASFLDRHRPTIEDNTLLNDTVISVVEIAQVPSEHAKLTPQAAEETGVEFAPIEEELGPNESRYAPLALWLQIQSQEGQDKVVLTFEQVEKIIDDKLPASARSNRSWWANDSVGHTQSQQWLDVGWRVSSVNIAEERVVFSLMGDRQSAYISFFTELQTKLQENDELTIKPAMNLQGRSWFMVEVRSTEFPETNWLTFSFARQSRFRIELYIDVGDQGRNKSRFDTLFSHKPEIEGKMGTSLSWERLDSKRASRIALYHEKTSITNPPEELENVQKWVIEMMPRFYWAIAPYTRKMEQTLKGIEAKV